MLLEIIIIIVSLSSLVFCAYKRYNFIAFIPLIIIVTVLLINEKPLMYYLFNIYMHSVVGFISSFFILMISGAVFGNLIKDSNIASSISYFFLDNFGKKKAIIVATVSLFTLNYVGISPVVSFVIIYPIIAHLFYESKISKSLVPATMAFGSFAFSSLSVGSMQLPNITVVKYIGSNIYSSGLYGVIFPLLIFTTGILWLYYRKNKLPFHEEKLDTITIIEKERPKPLLAFLPIILVIILTYILSNYYFAKQDPALYGLKDITFMSNTYSLIVALIISSIFIIIFYRKFLLNPINTITISANQIVISIFVIASVIGYGAVITSFSVFEHLSNLLVNSNLSPKIILTILVGMFSAITGAASGGEVIAFNHIFKHPLIKEIIFSLNKDVIHTISVFSSSCFSILPHHGGLLILFGITKSNHKSAYLDIFMVCLLFPLIYFSIYLFLI